MFRQLGQSPSESAVRDLVARVDYDNSGTVGFEEFCLLMLRQKRSANAPRWMRRMLQQKGEAPEEGPADSSEGKPLWAPTPNVLLAHPQFEAAAVIQRHASARNSRASEAEAPPGAPPAAPSKRRSVTLRKTSEAAAQVEDGVLSRELLNTVVDLLPGALHVESCVLNGYGVSGAPTSTGSP
eukprot:6268791-Prymnesium_polylepis.1